MDDFKYFFEDLKESLLQINNSIKDIDNRLKLLELDINKSKIYYSFLECNYQYFLEIIDKHKKEKDVKKDVVTNFLKNFLWGAFIIVCNLVLIAVIILILKIK